MLCWNQDTYSKAWNYASSIHRGQYVPGGEIPYINHIGLVAMEAMAAIAHGEKVENPDLLVVCALLHDSIEDTDTEYSDIENEFGQGVADGVLALSKNDELPSKSEKMEDSISRIKCQPKEVWMVKLCDRITNLQPPPSHWNRDKATKYRDEAKRILDELGEASLFLSNRLKAKIDSYRVYTSQPE
ncbi:HD domain-containing protein [Pseudomonadota bacterium]